MDIDLAALPDDVETLQRMVRTLATERVNLAEAQAEIERLRLIVQKLQRSQFGRRAERLDDDQLQLGFDDLNADIARVEATLPPTAAKAPRVRAERPSLPAHLPREDIRLDLEHQACPCCGGELHVIGETVSEMLDHVPARLRSSASAGPAMAVAPAGPSIKRPPRSGRSPRASPVPPYSPMSWSPNTAIIFRSTDRAKSLPGTASRSTARPWRTGWAAPAGGWSRCRPASQPMCSDQPSYLPTTRRSRCLIPAAAAPKPAGCGSMRATIDPRAGPNRRPPSISTVLIARQNVLPLISKTSEVCCKSTAMPASSG
jgi:hypothetical protein